MYYLFFLDLEKKSSYKMRRILKLFIFASSIFIFNLIIQRMSSESSGDLSNPLNLSLRVYATFLLFELFAIMNMGELMYVFSNLPKFSLVISMTIKFIKDLPLKVKNIREARKALGIYQGLKDKNNRTGKSIFKRIEKKMQNEKKKIKDLKIVFLAVFFSYIESGIEVSQSMLARFFGKKNRKTYKKYSFKTVDLILFTILISLILLAIMSFIVLKGNLAASKLEAIPIAFVEHISILIFLLPIFFLKIEIFNRSKHGLY